MYNRNDAVRTLKRRMMSRSSLTVAESMSVRDGSFGDDTFHHTLPYNELSDSIQYFCTLAQDMPHGAILFRPT